MISSRREYDFVTTAAGLAVDGGIMPARDVAGDASWRILRAEDVSFCLEASHERAVVAGTKRPSSSSVDRTIRGTRWVECVNALHACAERACREDAALAPKVLPAFLPDEATLDMVYPGIEFDKLTLRSDANRFAAKRGLEAEAVRDVFRDIGKLRAFHVNGSFERTSHAFEVARSADAIGVADAGASGNTIVEHIAQRWTDEHDRLSGGWTRATASEGFVRFHAPRPAGLPFHAGSATVAIEFEITVADGPLVGDPNVSRYYYIQPYAVDSGLSIRMSDIAYNAFNLGGAFGRYSTHEQLDNGQRHIVRVSIRSARAIVRLDGHTDFSHLNWN